MSLARSVDQFHESLEETILLLPDRDVRSLGGNICTMTATLLVKREYV